MRKVAVTNHAARLRKHGSEFGVRECDRGYDRGPEHPSPHGAWTCKSGGAPSSEQPPRSDYRTQSGEHQFDASNLAADRRAGVHADLLSSPGRCRTKALASQDCPGVRVRAIILCMPFVPGPFAAELVTAVSRGMGPV